MKGEGKRDWENYYSPLRSAVFLCLSRFLSPFDEASPRFVLRQSSDRGFEAGVMLIAPLPPAGNMYSCTERCAVTRKRQRRFEQARFSSFVPKGGKVTAPQRVIEKGRERERETPTFDKSGLTSRAPNPPYPFSFLSRFASI